jgi:glutamine synthetase
MPSLSFTTSTMNELEIIESLKANHIRFVRVLWCDNGNVIRAKAIHWGALSHHWQQGVGISQAQQAVPAMYDAPAAGSGLGPVGEVRLIPDWSTLKVLPYALGHARVLGNMMLDGEPWALCPRFFLQRMLHQAQQAGFTFKAAFENEFYLVQPSPRGPIPSDETVFAATVAMDRQHKVIDAISDALTAQGITIEQYYPESGPGQHEISVRYTDALSAADQQITFRETVRAVAAQHDLTASFLPKPFADKAGSGCHLHFSLWQGSHNCIPNPQHPTGLSVVARQFMAGLLEHLPALMALTTPTPNSYRRLHPHSWAGAFRCWGPDNREAALRVPSDPSHGSPTHIELKTLDATANPYLALGAILAAGLDGITRALDLPEGITVDPGLLTPEAQAQYRVERLPASLAEALSHLRQDQVLLNALGSELATAFLAVRHAESITLGKLDLAEEVSLLLERY